MKSLTAAFMIIILITLPWLVSPVFGQVPPPSSQVPIDGAAFLMMLLGAGLVIKKYLRSDKQI